jgi:hypothetical protein
MPRYEYKVIPAPQKGLKAKGVKGAEARFAHAVQEQINGLAGYGWEYLRAETLPSVERSGLTSSTTEWRNLLVFRRLREDDVDAFAPELLPAPDASVPEAVEQTAQEPEAAEVADEKPAVTTAEKDSAPAATEFTSIRPAGAGKVETVEPR